MKSRVFAVAVVSLLGAITGAGQSNTKTAAEAFKNIQVLKDIPADQLIPAMQFISASLDVECNFCHVQGKMDSDEKKPKETARQMITMTEAINKNNFGGHQEVTCYSCHHGSEHPAGTPAVQETNAAEHMEEHAPAGTPLTADQIIDKYVAAVGGADAIRKISSREEKGTILAGGHESPIEVYAKAPNFRMSIMQTPNGDSITAYDGKAGWLGNSGKPPRDMSAVESDAFALDAAFHFPLEIKSIFQQVRTGRPEKIGDEPCHVLIGVRQGQTPVRLYFDDKTGLLVRMVRYSQNPLGRMPTQIDYADYREEDGVKIPLRWTLARPNGRFTIQIREVKDNVPLEDAKFAKPAAGTK